MIEDYFTDKALLRRAGAVDRYGQAAQGNAIPILCRLRYKQRNLRTVDGNQLTSSVECMVLPETHLLPGDWIEHDGRNWEIVAVSRHLAFDAIYKVAYLGGSSSERSA